MKRRTREWIDKAEGDLAVALREMAAPAPVYDVICFHAQQCAEKYLKALLEEHKIYFDKTHDLLVLLELAAGNLPELDPLKAELDHLGSFGIAVRYPGAAADREAAEEAVRLAEEVRSVLKAKLEPPEQEEEKQA
jgi:HEPN domain-containing protein